MVLGPWYLFYPSTVPSCHIALAECKPYATFGAEHIEAGTVYRMETAMKLPVTPAGILMPDAHHGYGVPTGGVLATDNADSLRRGRVHR